MNNLTAKEIDNLIDALEAWEDKNSTGELLGDLMGAMLFNDAPPEVKEKFKRERDIERQKREYDKRERKETSLLLKAKLVQIKQSLTIDMANEVLNKS